MVITLMILGDLMPPTSTMTRAMQVALCMLRELSLTKIETTAMRESLIAREDPVVFVRPRVFDVVIIIEVWIAILLILDRIVRCLSRLFKRFLQDRLLDFGFKKAGWNQVVLIMILLERSIIVFGEGCVFII